MIRITLSSLLLTISFFSFSQRMMDSKGYVKFFSEAPLEDIEAKHFQTVHDLPHFRDFQENRNVILSKNRKELIKKIHLLIEKSKDPNFKYDIQKTCEYFVSKHSESYDIRILKLVNKCFQTIYK